MHRYAWMYVWMCAWIPRLVTTSYARMLKNLSELTSWGALTSVFGLPFDKVSGFPRKPKDAPDILNPSELYPDKELKLLLWGSPHGNPSSNDGSHHGPRTPEDIFQTQAFESMAWLCPRGTVIMTFPSKYIVEFYQPCSEAAAAKRILLCGPMYSRHYVPMTSSDGLRYTIPNATRDDIMISLLVPPSLMQCVVIANGRIDFASTVQGVLDTLDDREFGCALGVNDCSLEAELVARLKQS